MLLLVVVVVLGVAVFVVPLPLLRRDGVAVPASGNDVLSRVVVADVIRDDGVVLGGLVGDGGNDADLSTGAFAFEAMGRRVTRA